MSWDKFLMKKLLKSEVCGTREQSLLKSQNMRLRKKKKKKKEERNANVDSQTQIQTDG